MINPDTSTPGANSNPDLITGEPGSHPVGTGIGSAGGAAAGAAIGAVGGPIGSLVGGAIGAVAGGLAGKSVGEKYDPTVEDAYWKQNHGAQPYAAATGHQAAADHGATRTFDDMEGSLKSGYEKTAAAASLSWDHAKDATRAAYNRVADKH